MSITTAAVLSSASKAGRTVSLVLDAYSGGTSTFVYDSTSGATNGYVARIDPDGTYTPLAGGVVTATATDPTFNGNTSFSGTVGVTPTANTQTALRVNAPSAGTVDAVDIYVGATKKIWVDSSGVLNASAASIGTLTITSSLVLPGPITVAQGGTGTATPSLVNGNQVAITGAFPNQMIGVVSSPSFSSLALSGNMTITSSGTATSSSTLVVPSGGLTYNYSSWDSSAAVAHTWQLAMLTSGGGSALRFYSDGTARVAFFTTGGLAVKSVDGASNVISLNPDGSVSAASLSLTTALPISSGGTGSTAPGIGGTSGVLSVAGSFPNQTINLAHGDYADIVNTQTVGGAKTFSSAVTTKGLTLQDATDATKQASFVISSIATATTRSFTLPNVSGTLVTTGDTGSVTNTMLTGSIAITKLLASTISGISLGNNLGTLTFGTHLTGTSYNGSAGVTIATDAVSANTASTIVARDASGAFIAGLPTFQDPTDPTKQATFAVSTIATGTTRTFTFPNVSGALITTGDIGTVTNTMLAGSIAQSKLSAFAGLSVGGALSGATTGAFTGNISVTNAAAGAGPNISVFGPTSGTNGGAYLSAQASGGFVAAIGNKSSILGGAYDATPYIYTAGVTLQTQVGINAGGTITGTALTSTGGVAAGGAITGATTGSFSGALTALNLVLSATTGNAVMQFPSASAATTYIQGVSTVSTNGVNQGALGVQINNTTNLLALDQSGNFGVAGKGNFVGVGVGGTLTGATTGNFSGSVTGANFIATDTINGLRGNGNNVINQNGAAPNPLISTFSNVSTLGTGDARGMTLYHDGSGYGTGFVEGNNARGWSFLVYSGGAYPTLQSGFTRIARIDVSGNATFNGSGTFVGLSAGTGTVQGSSNGSTTSYLPPAYTAAGVAEASTLHQVYDTVTATSSTTTVTLSGAAVFANANYVPRIYDITAQTGVNATSQSAGSFTFASTSGHVYAFYAIGI